MPLASLIKIEWCCFNTTSCEALLSRHASHDYLILPHQRTLTVHSFADDLIITRVLTDVQQSHTWSLKRYAALNKHFVKGLPAECTAAGT
jgi:hypothetical protein